MRTHILAILLLVLVGCTHVGTPRAAPPTIRGFTLDAAATACLDWAWSVRRFREVAGGVLIDPHGHLVCSPLTIGTRTAVWYTLRATWLVHFHTHTIRGTYLSQADRRAVRDVDPMRRPGYMRQPNGTIWVYECYLQHEYPICGTRKVR